MPLFASLIIMSLFHVCIYKFDLMLHMLPEAHKNGGLQSTMQVLYWLIFVSQGTSIYECKIGGIIRKVVKTKQAYIFNYA